MLHISSITSFGLPGVEMLNLWANFTGESSEGCLNNGEAAAATAGVVEGFAGAEPGTGLSVVVVWVWGGLSNKSIKLSLLDCPFGSVCIRNLGGSSFSFSWAFGRQGCSPTPILISGIFLCGYSGKQYVVTSTVLVSKLAATQVSKTQNRKAPLFSL
jgi:hypothetical protein